MRATSARSVRAVRTPGAPTTMILGAIAIRAAAEMGEPLRLSRHFAALWNTQPSV